MLVPVLVVAGGKWCDPPASLCFILGRSSGPASPGATDRRYEAPRPGGAGIWRRNAPATRRWRDTAWTRVNCCSSLRGHRNSSVASQILQQLLANRASNEGYQKVREDFTIWFKAPTSAFTFKTL